MVSLSRGMQECGQYLGAVRGYSGATLSNYERTWSQFLAYLRSRGLGDEARHFTTEIVMGFCTELGQRGAVGNTILNKLHGLSTLARFLMKRKDGRGRAVLTSNPTLGFERPRETRPVTKFLHPEELKAFMEVPLSPELALIRELFMDTGIRCLEAVQANVGDLREIDGTVYLVIQVKGRRQSGGEPSSIPLSGACAELMRDSLLRRGLPKAGEPLLVDARGNRFTRSQLTQAMIRVGQRAGITRLTTSPHKLRHTANVVARMAGVDALTRAAMLNHRSMRTLARYDHLVPGEVVKGRELARQGLAAYLTQGHCETPLRLTHNETSANPA